MAVIVLDTPMYANFIAFHPDYVKAHHALMQQYQRYRFVYHHKGKRPKRGNPYRTRRSWSFSFDA